MPLQLQLCRRDSKLEVSAQDSGDVSHAAKLTDSRFSAANMTL
jgi:hypothetical protein